MKIQIRKDIHIKIQNLATLNKIPPTILMNKLLERMLNRHHQELSKIIMEMKQKWPKQDVPIVTES